MAPSWGTTPRRARWAPRARTRGAAITGRWPPAPTTCSTVTAPAALDLPGYFDLATDAGIVDIDYYGTIGEFGIRYGYFDGTNPVLGGSLWSGPSRSNALVTVDADTLVPIADRTILDGLSPAALTLHDGELLALLSDRIVVVGDDGRAERTYKVAGIGPRSMRGIASAGGTLYVLARDDSTGWAHIYEVELE